MKSGIFLLLAGIVGLFLTYAHVLHSTGSSDNSNDISTFDTFATIASVQATAFGALKIGRKLVKEPKKPCECCNPSLSCNGL